MKIAAAKLLPFLLFLSFYATGAAAQYVIRTPTPTPTPRPSPTPTPEPRNVPCPSIGVQPQSGPQVRDGQKTGFIANIAGGDPKVIPVLLWSTSAGFITQGQGTRRIEVDTTGAGSAPDREIRADIWVGGYAPECQSQASATVKIIAPAAKFGDFGEVAPDVLERNLKALADYMAQSPDNLWLIAYAGRNSERGFTFAWIKRIKDGLIQAGVPPRRIMAIDGGFHEQPLFDFWIVPIGAEPPRPAPTVDRSEIVYPKTAPAKKP
jgi:hypothetical protein